MTPAGLALFPLVAVLLVLLGAVAARVLAQIEADLSQTFQWGPQGVIGDEGGDPHA